MPTPTTTIHTTNQTQEGHMDNDTQQIQRTRDYTKFVLLGANRDVNEMHVNSLIRAFQEKGNLTRIQPILVNENMAVIDGQHRLAAAQSIGEPVYYTVVEGLNILDARDMNLNHKAWGLLDYAKMYAASGNTNYQRFLKLQEDYAMMAPSNLLYFTQTTDSSGYTAKFRQGELVMTKDNVHDARTKLDQLLELAEYVPKFGLTRYFVQAFRQVVNLEAYDHQRMVNKFKLFGSQFTQRATREDTIRALEDIYNYKNAEINRVRFF